MKKTTTIIYAIFLGCFLHAQDSIPLPTQALEVVKQFEPKIEDAKPIDISPKLSIQTEYPSLNLSYATPPQIFTIAYPDPVIKPLVYEEEDESVNYRDGYVKLGYGNNFSPLVEGQVHYDIQNWFQTGISLKHMSARDTTPEVFRSTYRTLAEFYVSYFLTDQTKVTADVHYQVENRNYCCSGIKEFVLLPSTKLDNYGLALRIDHNSFSVKGFSTKHNLAVNRVNSRANTQSEYQFSYSSNTNKTINKQLMINLPLGFDYYKSSLWNEDPFQWELRPNLLFKNKNLSIRGGAYLASNDTLYVRPDVSVSYLLPWNDLEAKASYRAESSVNSLHKFYREMPYFIHVNDGQTSFAEEEIARLGVRYKNDQADVYFGGLYGNYTDQAVYTYLELGKHFYELMDYRGFGIELNGAYRFKKILSLEADVKYQKYNVEEFSENEMFVNPFYIPQFQANVKLEQRFFKGLTIYETLRFVGARSFKFQDSTTNFISSIDPFADIGAGIEYIHNNKLGVFAEANNLLNESYERFYLDKSFKLNYHLGIKFLF